MSTQRKNSVKDILTKLFVTSFAVCFLWAANYAEAQTQVMDGVDDGTVHINLGHTFPYYGGVFTDAWMSSNGFIILYDPTTGFGNSNTGNNGCCNGFNPGGAGHFSYMLAPLWTDLRHNTSIPDSGYFYETGTDGTAFLWKNITEYGTNNLNTFGVQLWPDGSFDFHYADVNITNHTTWIGFTGDTTSVNGNVYDEVNELFYKTAQEGGMTTDHIANFASETFETDGNTYYAWYGQDGGYESTGPDCSNPLNDPSCEGYEEAYFNQQCEQNPLYDTQCPGYEQAYYEQQCSADPLYDSGCPGYAEAYHDLQCSLDSLYKDTCPGYKDALFDYNCTLDPQYDMMCPGYIDEEIFVVDDTKDDFSGVDDGKDDGTEYDAYGNIKKDENLYYEESTDEYFYEPEVIEKIMKEEELIFVQSEEIDTGSDEIVANDGKVNEEKILEEQVEEELVILEEMEVVEVLEEKILEEEVELDEVELVPVTEKVVATSKIDAKSLVLEQTAKLVSNLREESAESGSVSAENSVSESISGQNATQNQENVTQASENVTTNQQNVQELDVIESENGGSDGFYGTDMQIFTQMTGMTSSNTENVSNDTESVSNTTENEQSVALGDSAPIGFAIIPVQQAGGVVEIVVPVEEQSLAERLAEQVRQKNLENSNEAAVGQTAVLQQIASGTDMSAYYDKTPTYKQDMYTQEQVYGNIVLTDNVKSHYKMFSENHGTMQELIRSQY